MMASDICPCCGQALPDAYAKVAETCGLSPQQTELFLTVAAGSGNTVHFERIINRLWGHDPNGGPDDPLSGIAVRVHNANKRLEASGYRIENVWGIGYRLRTVIAGVAA